MQKITTKQIQLIKTLLRKFNIDSPTMALGYSDGRTEHISQLWITEATTLIKFLVDANNQPVSPKEKMQNKILSMAHEMGWELPFTRTGKSNVIDMDKVDNWCIRYGYLGMPLDLYEEHELPRLVTQFEKAYKDYLKKV